MIKYQHIIWDWNGTLLNDVWLSVDIVNSMLESHNDLQLNPSSYRDIFDFPIKGYYTRLGFDFEKESFESLCDKFISYYDRRVEECSLHNGARSIINQLDEMQIGQSVLSAAEQGLLESMVKKFSVSRYFKDVSGLADNFARSKVENGKQMITNLGVNPNEVVLIGDTTHDFEVAEAIGVDCILVSHGHHPKEKLAAKAPVVDSFNELVRVLV